MAASILLGAQGSAHPPRSVRALLIDLDDTLYRSEGSGGIPSIVRASIQREYPNGVEESAWHVVGSMAACCRHPQEASGGVL